MPIGEILFLLTFVSIILMSPVLASYLAARSAYEDDERSWPADGK